MPWFVVDDQLPFHPKVIQAGNAAMGLWVRAGSWCAAHLTEGRLPYGMVSALGGHRRDARKLVEVGLWEQPYDGSDDYQFKDWAQYQQTKDQVEAKREADRQRKRRQRNRDRGEDVSADDSAPVRHQLGTSSAPARHQWGMRTMHPSAVDAELGDEFPQVDGDSKGAGHAVTPAVTPPVSHGPLSLPIPSSSGYVEEVSPVSNAREIEPPSSKCPRHLNDPNPPACRACGEARQARSDWEARKARESARARSAEAHSRAQDRRRAIDACSLCDGEGYIGTDLCAHAPAPSSRPSLTALYQQERAKKKAQ